MKKLCGIFWFLLPVCLVVIADEVLKHISLNKLPDEGSLVNPGFLSFAIHKNWGVAFDIPLNFQLMLIESFVIGCLLLWLARKNLKTNPLISFALFIIVLGALGNLFDRVFYGFTVDYLILFGRSAFNLSDLIIIFGVLILFFSKKSRQTRT